MEAWFPTEASEGARGSAGMEAVGRQLALEVLHPEPVALMEILAPLEPRAPPGPTGNNGSLATAAITQAEWEEEMTQPWLTTLNPPQGIPGTVVTAAVLNVDSGDPVLVNGQTVAATYPSTGEIQFTDSRQRSWRQRRRPDQAFK